ncbi:MAG: PilZ domain-containing protein [Nitrospirae bacterium]|nr:PilZ domain-containing protein [Nitrospirota bacterium]
MQERRHYQRFSVDIMDIHGKILFASDVKILNISIGGILLKADKRLNIGRSYILKLENRGKNLTIQGTVVRCTLSESQRVQGNIIPIYTAGMQFTNLSNEKMNEIADFIKDNFIDYQNREVFKPDMFKMSGIRLHVRFHIDDPEKATVHYFDVYKVTKISLNGMLIESEEAVKVEDKLPMEMTLSENEILRFFGRISRCQPIKDTDPSRYEIGIEFIEISEQEKTRLKTFINSL